MDGGPVGWAVVVVGTGSVEGGAQCAVGACNAPFKHVARSDTVGNSLPFMRSSCSSANTPTVTMYSTPPSPRRSDPSSALCPCARLPRFGFERTAYPSAPSRRSNRMGTSIAHVAARAV